MDKQSRKQIGNDYKNRKLVGGVFAVSNSANGKRLVQYATDLNGSRNRFDFSRATGGCAFKPLEEDCKKYGTGVFSFEILEKLEQKEGQTTAEFQEEIKALYSLLTESMDKKGLY
jgi:hypothetical protein